MAKKKQAAEQEVSARLPLGLLTGAMVALFIGIALYLRIYLPYDKVFVGDVIKLTGNDAYYHLRLVDNFARNFPNFITFDPYMIYPGGSGVGSIHFFDWFLAGLIWVISLGSPTQHTIDVVSVYFPTILAALTVIPVYFLGKELLGRWAGVIAAGLIAILPGEFLGRSILGFTDHHVAEVLLTTTTMLFLTLAIKTAKQRQLTFNHFKRRYWATSARPVRYSLLAGIFLGIYLLTWIGGLLFVFIISTYFIIQFTIDHLKHKSSDYLCLVGVILFLAALIVFQLGPLDPFYLVPLVVALLIPLSLNGISRLMTRKEIKPAYYPLTVAGLGLAGLGIFHMTAPSLLGSMLDAFSIFAPTGASLTTMEMQPFLFEHGRFTLWYAWGNFTTSFFFGFIALAIFIYLVIKHGDAEKSLIVVWSLVILAATLGQRRFTYYFVVNVALLTSYLSWRIVQFVAFKQRAPQPVPRLRRRERRKTRVNPKRSDEGGFTISRRRVTQALGVIAILFVVFYPNVGPTPPFGLKLAFDTAKTVHFAPSDAWYRSLSWLKENTPEPFGNPDYYYGLYEVPPGESYQYPKSAYGVLAWWDYGYWITRIAHRPPNANPSQDPVCNTKVARFFSSQEEDSADEIRQELGSAYIVIDYETTNSKFWAIATWAGKETTEFFEDYYLPREDRLQKVTLLYPEYYRSLVVRLYNFDGKAVTTPKPIVISYQEKRTPEGQVYKQITSAKPFPSYEEAAAYVSSQKGNYRIIGNDPFTSPVPLDALKRYRLVYASTEKTPRPGGGATPSVKIFEYTK